MKHIFRRVLSLVLALMLVMSLSLPAFAADSTITPLKGTYVVPMASAKGVPCTPTFGIAGGNQDFTIKRSSVKLDPGNTDAKLVAFKKNTNTNYQTDVFNTNGTWQVSTNSAHYQYYVQIQVSVPGTAKLSYKIGNTTYKVTLKFVPYTNRTSTITLTGVNSDKNFASLTKKAIWPSKNLTLPATVKNAKLKVVAADNEWLIKYVQIEDLNTGVTRQISSRNGMKSVTLSCGTLNVKHNYNIHVQYYSENYGWNMGGVYYLHGAKAS